MPNGKKKDEKEKSVWDYIRDAAKTPFAAISAVILAIVIAFATGFGTWLSDKAAELAQSGCEAVGWCEGEPTELWVVRFSTAVEHCAPGRLSHMLRDWKPPVDWHAGAERLVICANAEVTGPKADIPKLIGDKFPGCLAVKPSGQSIAVKTKLDDPSVCRAPYRFDGETLIDADLPSGVFVCIPGAARALNQPTFTQDGVAVPACTEQLLGSNNFL